MDLLNELLAQTDWSALEHAYGPASDTPFQLLALLSDDIEARSAAVGHLDSAILHQGSVYSATGPAARVVAAMLKDPLTMEPVEDVVPWDDAVPRPVRLDLVDFLARVADSCRFDDTDDAALSAAMSAAVRDGEVLQARNARDLLACRAAAPELLDALTPVFDDPDGHIQVKALEAAVRLSDHEDLAGFRRAIGDRLDRVAVDSCDPRSRAAAARLLGMLGARPLALLHDAHPGVRACAALAPALADEPRATRAILDALLAVHEADHWFEEHLPGQDGWLRFDLTRAAAARVDDFEALLPAALAVLPLAGGFTLDRDLGPFLTAAFARPRSADAPLSLAQRTYLSAVLDREELWRSVSAEPWFPATGLPAERAACRALVEASEPSDGETS
ncbi:HEAT repeat domain-containing protein [Streptomyces crystallinus]|uniref:HEAT repeat domain-containing protein n=1 Tax=Streptomyces crystallinus TaxID=68191 RepID=A0ABN1FKT1_9ACTN